jgi:hypothetical protein
VKSSVRIGSCGLCSIKDRDDRSARTSEEKKKEEKGEHPEVINGDWNVCLVVDLCPCFKL